MKKDIWEEKFSDNYKANFFESLIKRFEVYRQNEIIKLLPDTGSVLIDLACGDGNLIYAVCGRFKQLFGFDIASNRINNAKKKQYKNKKVIFKNVDLDKGIPLKDQSAEVAVCEASLGFFYDPEFFLDEVNRILKHKGILIVQVANFVFLPRRCFMVLGKLPKTSSFQGFGDGGTKYYFTHSVLRKLLSDYGFKVTDQTNSGIFPSVRRLWPSLLSSDIIFKAVKVK